MSALQRAAAAAAPRLPLARSRVPEVCALERERLLELLPRLWQQRLGSSRPSTASSIASVIAA